jgi:drug/metabolite transporter (DMT)-like permease
VSAGAPVGGLLVAAAAAACYEISYALQALEARAVAPAGPGPHASLLGRLLIRPLFAAAIALALAGYGLQVAALGLAPLTAVQPVLALGLLLLLYLGSRILGESVGAREVVGVLVIVAGVAGIALAAPERSATAGGTRLWLALGVLGLASAAPFALGRAGRAGGAALAVAAGAADAWAAVAAKLVSDELSRGRPLAALAWGAGAGVAVLMGLTCELTALQRMAATRVAPVVLAIQIAVPVALAGAVAGEDWGATPLGGGVLATALAAVTVGAILLGASGAVGDLVAGGHDAPVAAGQLEHERSGGRQGGE